MHCYKHVYIRSLQIIVVLFSLDGFHKLIYMRIWELVVFVCQIRVFQWLNNQRKKKKNANSCIEEAIHDLMWPFIASVKKLLVSTLWLNVANEVALYWTCRLSVWQDDWQLSGCLVTSIWWSVAPACRK